MNSLAVIFEKPKKKMRKIADFANWNNYLSHSLKVIKVSVTKEKIFFILSNAFK